MALDTAKTLFEIAYYLVAIGAAIAAVVVYNRNRRLEQSRWTSMFYEKFYESDRYTKMRVLLDCSASGEINSIVENEPVEFNDYLNFFEHVAIFTESKQLRRQDVEASFAYYLNCLDKQPKVKAYIDDEEKGYEKLRAYLKSRKNLR